MLKNTLVNLDKDSKNMNQMIKDKLILNDPWYQLILEMLKLTVRDFNKLKLIEVGCGFGGFLIYVARRGATVIGLDISSHAILLARDLVKQAGLQEKVDLIIGDAQFLPFKEESGDLIVCSETLEHVQDYKKAFNELVRIIKKSGHLCLTVPNFLSTLFFENVILLLIGQPNYVRSNLCVEKEHIFHVFKLKKLLSRNDLSIITVRSVDFFHLPPRLRKFLKIDRILKIASNRLGYFIEKYHLPLRLIGAHIGILAEKK
jgi:2-polyprenyl-3-methyl-5-hydroxy-6-metoxy-1,4-benzoquinol methylase